MEVHKRKCINGEEIEVKKHIKMAKDDGESKTPASVETGAVVVGDDEVEEFYAILRRIRVAVKYFEKGTGTAVDGGAGRNLTAALPWKLDFRQGDFKRSIDDVNERERVEDNVDLDLNADPVAGPNSEAD